MEPDESNAKESMNNKVAVTVAILAAFMAVTKVKDDNICQAMVKEKDLVQKVPAGPSDEVLRGKPR